MRFVIYLLLISGMSAMAASEDDSDTKCERILSIISDIKPSTLAELYAYKKRNNNQWRKLADHGGVSYLLEPKEILTYTVSWTTKKNAPSSMDFESGKLICEIPSSWRLAFDSPVNITYPKVTHDHTQDLPLYSVTTVAGIYLGKSKFSLQPDISRIMWHLKQDEVPPDIAQEVLASHEFVGDNVTIVGQNGLDKTSQVQLIALNLSNKREFAEGNFLWLVANLDDHEAIANGSYRTPESPHNTLLPWFDPKQKEFLSATPLEAYETTIVGPLGILSVFDHKSGHLLPEPLTVQDKTQMVHDAIAPSVYRFNKGSEPLFAHLILKQPLDFRLLTFEILRDGTFNALSNMSLEDPSQVGLPRAFELGFVSLSEN